MQVTRPYNAPSGGEDTGRQFGAQPRFYPNCESVTHPYPLMLRQSGLRNLLNLRFRQRFPVIQSPHLTQQAVSLERRRDYNPSVADLVCPFHENLIIGDFEFGRDAIGDRVDGSTRKVCDGS